jgi:hypothetical protein
LARIDTPRRNGEKQENKVSQSVGFSVCWERVDKRIKKKKQESRPTNSSIKHYTWEWEGGGLIRANGSRLKEEAGSQKPLCRLFTLVLPKKKIISLICLRRKSRMCLVVLQRQHYL